MGWSRLGWVRAGGCGVSGKVRSSQDGAVASHGPGLTVAAVLYFQGGADRKDEKEEEEEEEGLLLLPITRPSR